MFGGFADAVDDSGDLVGDRGRIDFLGGVANDVSNEGLAEVAQQAAEGGVGRIPFSSEEKEGCAVGGVADKVGGGLDGWYHKSQCSQ